MSEEKPCLPNNAAIRFERCGDKPASAISEVRDILARLRFAPQDGRIWLADQRMLLLHGSVFSALRREMLETLDVEGAKAMLMRVGYSAGARDAALAITIRSGSNLDKIFAVGPQLHALEGFVAVEPVRIDIDVERGIHYVEQIWHDSAEASAHIEASGVASESVCWMQTGYASGFNSALFGRPILFREVECRGAGAKHCRIIGKPMEEWENSDVESSFLRPEDFINAALVRKTTPFAGSPENLPLPSDSDFMVGASSGFLSACHKLRQVAPTNATVLLLGETGVGKERFANMLHRLSARGNGPFVALNCAAIPDNLLEAELFGVERGAFTGATESRKGRFERADGGTLFLDEIGTLNEASQAKLLRALQERVIERVGGGTGRAVDVRVVAATNANLSDAVKAGKFRGDLFYRLNVFPIQIPPLRERRDDIALLLDHFVKKFSDAHDKVVSGFTSRAISALLTYGYPGNVRELENLIERGVIMVPNGKAIDRHHLFQAEEFLSESLLGIDKVGGINLAESAHFNDPVDETLVSEIAERALDASLSLEALESAAIKEAVRRADGNLSQAARLLGISRAQVAYRLEKHKGE